MIFCQLCPTSAESGNRDKDGLERCPGCGTAAILSDVDFPTLAEEIREWDAHVARLKLACDDGELGDCLEDVVRGAIYGEPTNAYGETLSAAATLSERRRAFFDVHREPGLLWLRGRGTVELSTCERCGADARDFVIGGPVICAPQNAEAL